MFEIEGDIECPHCGHKNWVTTSVPESAWQPGGASFTEKHACTGCEEEFEISGSVESSLELS